MRKSKRGGKYTRISDRAQAIAYRRRSLGLGDRLSLLRRSLSLLRRSLRSDRRGRLRRGGLRSRSGQQKNPENSPPPWDKVEVALSLVSEI